MISPYQQPFADTNILTIPYHIQHQHIMAEKRNVDNTPNANQTSSTGAQYGWGWANTGNPPVFQEPSREERREESHGWHEEKRSAKTNVGNANAVNDQARAGSTSTDWAGPARR